MLGGGALHGGGGDGHHQALERREGGGGSLRELRSDAGADAVADWRADALHAPDADPDGGADARLGSAGSGARPWTVSLVINVLAARFWLLNYCQMRLCQCL